MGSHVADFVELIIQNDGVSQEKLRLIIDLNSNSQLQFGTKERWNGI